MNPNPFASMDAEFAAAFTTGIQLAITSVYRATIWVRNRVNQDEKL